MSFLEQPKYPVQMLQVSTYNVRSETVIPASGVTSLNGESAEADVAAIGKLFKASTTHFKRFTNSHDEKEDLPTVSIGYHENGVVSNVTHFEHDEEEVHH